MKISVVYNACYGGFQLSDEAEAECERLGGDSSDRFDPRLAEVVNRLGAKKASGEFSALQVELVNTLEYPGFQSIEIHEYDGSESVRVNQNPVYVKLGKILAAHSDDSGPVAVAVRRLLDKNRAEVEAEYGKYDHDAVAN